MSASDAPTPICVRCGEECGDISIGINDEGPLCAACAAKTDEFLARHGDGDAMEDEIARLREALAAAEKERDEARKKAEEWRGACANRLGVSPRCLAYSFSWERTALSGEDAEPESHDHSCPKCLSSVAGCECSGDWRCPNGCEPEPAECGTCGGSGKVDEEVDCEGRTFPMDCPKCGGGAGHDLDCSEGAL